METQELSPATGRGPMIQAPHSSIKCITCARQPHHTRHEPTLEVWSIHIKELQARRQCMGMIQLYRMQT